MLKVTYLLFLDLWWRFFTAVYVMVSGKPEPDKNW